MQPTVTTQKTELDPRLEAMQWGGTAKEMGLTGILGPWFSGSLAQALPTVTASYGASGSTPGAGGIIDLLPDSLKPAETAAPVSEPRRTGPTAQERWDRIRARQAGESYAPRGGMAGSTGGRTDNTKLFGKYDSVWDLINGGGAGQSGGIFKVLEDKWKDTDRTQSPIFANGGPVKYQTGGSVDTEQVGLMELARQLATGTDLGALMPDQQVAGFTQPQQQAFNLATAGVGAYQPYLQTGTDVLGQGVAALGQMGGALGQGLNTLSGTMGSAQPYQTEAAQMMRTGAGMAAGATGQYDPTSYQAYMNPYTQDVINAAETDAARQAKMLGQNIAASAIGSGAYGGTREAVQRAEGARNLGQQLAAQTSGLRQAGYTQAQQLGQGAYEAAQGRGLQAAGLTGNLGQGLGSLGTQYGQLGLQTGLGIGQLGGQYGNLGSQYAGLGGQYGQFGQLGSQLGLQDINTLLSIGGQQQGQRQTELDTSYQNAYRRLMAPYQQVGFLADIVSGQPTGTTTTMTQPAPSPFSQILGLGGAAYNMMPW